MPAENKQGVCQFCGKQFDSGRALAIHVQHEHLHAID